jgi:3-oxoacyl-[acyl-carrier protein] reductase
MGRATAFLLADEGATVAVTDVVDPAPVVDVIAKAGGEAIGRILDVSDGAAIARVVSDVAAHFGGIDILINNAGIASSAIV